MCLLLLPELLDCPRGHLRSRGFSLTELAIVLAVIALAVMLLNAAYGSVSASAAATDCRGKLRQLGMAGLHYAQDNRGYLAPCRIWHGAAADGKDRTWSDETQIGGYIGAFDGMKRTPLYRCRADRRGITPWNQYDASFGINSGVVGEIYQPEDWTSERKPIRLSMLVDPGRKMGFSDATDLWIYLTSGWYVDPVGQVRIIPNDVPYSNDYRGSAVSRHRGTTSLAFLDGRVEASRGVNLDALAGNIQVTRGR